MPRITVNLSCAICFDTGDYSDWTSLGACGHMFHIECIRQWTTPPPPEAGQTRRKAQNICPTCRCKILRPGGRGNTTKENSRFRKLIFNGDVIINPNSSSSPVRLRRGRDAPPSSPPTAVAITSNLARRSRVINSVDSGDEIDGNGIIMQPRSLAAANAEEDLTATESESDGENARPARPVYGRGSRALREIGAADTIGIGNNTLGEARATIARKNAEIIELRRTLEDRADEIQAVKAAHEATQAELQAIEERWRQRADEVRRVQDALKMAKDERKGFKDSLTAEVRKSTALNSSNRKLLDEITELKQAHESLEKKYNELQEVYNDAIEDHRLRYDAQKASADRYKDQFERAHYARDNLANKLERKKSRITALEAALAKYTEADEAKRRENGQSRASNQDVDDGDLTHLDMDIDQRAFAAPRSRQTSYRSLNDPSIIDGAQTEEFDESLLVTGVSDDDYGNEIINIDDDDDSHAFSDLDIIMPGRHQPGRKGEGALLPARKPLRERTNSSGSRGISSTSNTKDDKNDRKRPLSTIASENKWTDMVLEQGRGVRAPARLAIGAKKKTKMTF